MHARAPGRILALDLGSRRIGLAVTDELGLTAQGIDTLERKNKRADLVHLGSLISQYGITEIVVGHPLHMSGDSSPKSLQAAEFADVLRDEFRLPVHLWDERLTSTQANRLLREAEATLRQRKQAVDRMAATLILQSFLESRHAATAREASPGRMAER